MKVDLVAPVMLATQVVEGAKRFGGEPNGRTPLNEVGREQVEEIEIVWSDHLLPDSRKHHGVIEERVGAGASARKPDDLDPRSDVEFGQQVAPVKRRVECDLHHVLPT